MGNSYSRVAHLSDLGPINVSTPNFSRSRDFSPVQDCAALPESVFQSMLTLERRRAERSSKAFVLMLLDAKQENGAAAGLLKHAAEIAQISKRETDLLGWYQENAILGVVFIEVNLTGESPIMGTLKTKIEAALIKHMGRDKAGKIAISMHLFPETGA